MSILTEIKENPKILAPNPNTVKQQVQVGRPTPVVEPHEPIESTSNTTRLSSRTASPAPFSSVGDLKQLDRPKIAKPSSGTFDAHDPAISSNKLKSRALSYLIMSNTDLYVWDYI